jgi:hypothetical protein
MHIVYHKSGRHRKRLSPPPSQAGNSREIRENPMSFSIYYSFDPSTMLRTSKLRMLVKRLAFFSLTDWGNLGILEVAHSNKKAAGLFCSLRPVPPEGEAPANFSSCCEKHTGADQLQSDSYYGVTEGHVKRKFQKFLGEIGGDL